jgi:DNA mismatch repair protein MutL
MGIVQLAPDVAAKIAAGEVIERPASIVKELVENAIDAGATRITVELQGGGITSLRVSDNGGGIPREELPLAFARHATSKINAIGDLDRLHTLGFRGEALASVVAVADVTLASRPADAPNGARIMGQMGKLGEVSATAMPPGTIVTVRDLFAQVPARLKFLKTPQSEAGACAQLLDRYALAYPEIQFTLTHDNRLSLRTPGDNEMTSVIAQVYDLKVAEQMVPLFYGPTEDMEPVPLIERPPTVTGMTSRPACFKTTRQHVTIFVNRRWVRSSSLQHAVEEAYHSLLLGGRYPISVINVSIDPALVDVNVHPAKTEVKFARERQVYAAVQRAVRAAVVQTTEAPAISSSAFTPIASAPPSMGDDEDEESRRDVPLSPAGKREGESISLWNADDLRQSSQRPNTSVPVAVPSSSERLPVLRVLGQVSQSYIITEGPDGVYLIDQHAAHERILLERMVAQWRKQEIPSQALLEPIAVELSAETFAAVDERLDDLRHLGFVMEPFGITTLLVRAVPAPLAKHSSAAALAELLPELVGGDHAGHAETWEEHALANIACKAAIKAGQSLSPEEQRELVRQLEGADARHSCCHGRPTTVHLSLDVLERQFARR